MVVPEAPEIQKSAAFFLPPLRLPSLHPPVRAPARVAAATPTVRLRTEGATSKANCNDFMICVQFGLFAGMNMHKCSVGNDRGS